MKKLVVAGAGNTLLTEAEYREVVRTSVKTGESFTKDGRKVETFIRRNTILHVVEVK